jgi:FKBP-type peptidyl-prolyl cis-trans isomerase (trigger factor)
MARESVATDLALEALFRTLEFELTDDDVDAEMLEMAGGEGDPAEMRARFEEAGLIKVVQEQAMHRKATMWLLENVAVVESEDADERAPRAYASDDATDVDEPDDADADASGEE